jgi:hypothetical protein
MSTTTTTADADALEIAKLQKALEKHNASEKFYIEHRILNEKITSLHEEMQILPRTTKFLVRYEKLYIQRAEELDTLLFNNRIMENRALVIEKFSDHPEVIAEAMHGFDEMLREHQTKKIDLEKHFLNRDIKNYYVYIYLGSKCL